jgi:hypothetical protein
VIELDRVPSTVTEGPEFSVGRKRVRFHSQRPVYGPFFTLKICICRC